MKNKNNYNGFTIAELLIVVGIIAVLVAIAVVIFNNRLEKSKQAVDMTTMRSAKSAILIEMMTTSNIQADGFTRYYYYPSGIVSTTPPSKGYGKSRTNASMFWRAGGVAHGVPNVGGSEGILSMTVTQDGIITFYWGGAYTGENVTNPAMYQSLSYQEKLRKDILLLDSLQGEFRGMTYGQLKSLIMNDNGTIKQGLVKGTIDGYLCITIANGTITSTGQVITGNRKTQIYLPDVFQNVGFDTSLPDTQTYIVNSVDTNTNTIWLNLRIKESDLAHMDNSDDKWYENASNAYTYVKSDGAATPDELREAIRKKK